MKGTAPLAYLLLLCTILWCVPDATHNYKPLMVNQIAFCVALGGALQASLVEWLEARR